MVGAYAVRSTELQAADSLIVEVGGKSIEDVVQPQVDEATRKRLGITYTPDWVVEKMVEWAARHATPARVVDPGAGTGHFTVAVALAFPDAQVIAVELQPSSASALRERVARLGLSDRVTVIEGDYLLLDPLPEIDGRTLFIGNPPYVRHHLIDAHAKAAFVAEAARLGFKASGKAGLHLHFFQKSRTLARSGDYGTFIAAAEWVHADYGGALRAMLLDGMGGMSVDTFAETEEVFPNVMTTAAVVCFEVGRGTTAMAFSEVSREAFEVGRGALHTAAELRSAKHWSSFARGGPVRLPKADTVPLSHVFRVKRGQVTGDKRLWVHGADKPPLPARYLFKCVTSAREIVTAGGVLSPVGLLDVIDLPHDLNAVDDPKDAVAVRTFVDWAEGQGGTRSFIAKQRPRWWSVRLYEPAPLVCTCMGRRPPVFAANPEGVRHLNIAHGLYPRAALSDRALSELVGWLNSNVGKDEGRAYANGLVKFEPSDIASIRVPVDLVQEALSEIAESESHVPNDENGPLFRD